MWDESFHAMQYSFDPIFFNAWYSPTYSQIVPWKNITNKQDDPVISREIERERVLHFFFFFLIN